MVRRLSPPAIMISALVSMCMISSNDAFSSSTMRIHSPGSSGMTHRGSSSSASYHPLSMATNKLDKQQEVIIDLLDTSQSPSSLSFGEEPMFSMSYDPLEPPNQMTLERDLEDFLMERALRFYDEKTVRQQEKCYLVGLEDKSLNEREDGSKFTMEESMTELSELAGAAGLSVVGSTYQRVQRPNIEYYVGPGKLKDIVRSLSRHKCTCVIFDVELSPAQQKNLELSFNQENNKGKNAERIKIIDRTALILDIFAQHARTKEGQLQVQLALLTYRLPRLTNMWTHLERQSAGARGRSNGGVGLRGPGEKQLESDRREMKSKIAILNRAIDSVRRHRQSHRRRRRRLGLPVVALVGYTNAGKSTLLNSFTSAGVFTADMLFATLDPTTRLVRVAGLKNPDMLLTDTVGFIQKLPTNLVAAFRATLEEITEADVLLHVTDVSNDAWRKQEAAVLRELATMGLAGKPIVTVWNKIDLAPDRKEFLKFEAQKRPQTVAMSAFTSEGSGDLMRAMESALSSQMETISCTISYNHVTLLSTVHNLGILDEVQYLDEGVFVRGKVPLFLKEQIDNRSQYDEEVEGEGAEGSEDDFDYPKLDIIDAEEEEEFDWSGMAKGRHSARREWDKVEGEGGTDSLFRPVETDGPAAAAAEGTVGYRGAFSALGGHRALSISDLKIAEGGAGTGQRTRKRKATTTENRRKQAEADGDEFNDTSKLLDFDAGDYYGSKISSVEEDEEEGTEE